MAKVATVRDFEALKNESGLIPMRFLKPTITEFKDDIRGAEPGTALRWYTEGLAEPVGKLKASGDQADEVVEVENDEVARKNAVDLGTDPLNAHRLTKIAKAKQLKGSDESLNEQQANEIIQAELDRRGGKTDAGPNAVTSQSVVTK